MTFVAGQVLTAAQLNALDITSLTVDTDTLVVDATNDRVGINTASPSVALDVGGSVVIDDDLTVDTSTLKVDSTNNRVGIGTASPSQALDVSGNIALTGEIDGPSDFTVSNGQGEGIEFSQTDNATHLKTLGADRLTINSSGNVGIGTTSPSTRLHVNSGNTNTTSIFESTDSAAYIGIKDNASSGNIYVGIGAVGDELRLRAGNANRVTVTSGGKVGIGTTAPETPLNIVTTNKLGSTFTGTTDGEGVRVDQSNYTSGNYVSLIEGSYDDGQTAPHVRVGALFTGSGSTLAFGTSNSYASGITNTALTINQAGLVAWSISSGIGGPLTDTSSTSGYRYVLQNQTFGTLFDFTSVRERKDQITSVTAEDSGRWIDALQPVTYIERWMGEGDEPDDARAWREADMQVGFIADDILANADTDHFSQVLDDGEGGLDPAGWKWECVIAAAVAEIKSLRTRVATLEAA